MLVVGQKLKQKKLKLLRKDYRTKKLQENIMYQKIPYLHGSKIKTKSCHHWKNEKMQIGYLASS